MPQLEMSRTAARPADRPDRVLLVRWGVLLGTVALLALCVVASLTLGSSTIPAARVRELLLAPDGSNDSYIVHGLRVPRTIIGLLVGIALGVSGAVMQTLTRNPLADPGLLGVTSGASLAVVAGAAAGVVATPAAQLTLAATGALVASGVVLAVGTRGGASPIRLVLTGVAFSAACGGVIQGLLLANPRAFDAFRYWDVGALTRTDLPLWTCAVPVAVGLGLVVLLRRGLADVALGDDVAAALGTNVVLVRVGSLIALTLMCAAATATAGPIAFVGLMAPVVAGRILGPARGWILTLSAPFGALLVLSADVLGRVLARPAEMPVGLLTAFVGAPVLLAVVLRNRAERG
ncbi:iron ABC transporter permease [Sanguibacter sp. HDW7]|uniref:FecCD family ABC transporter permease n=1 Tax=Sanguibacter sp. HDW7 TaxID=2714931 RepID=UPI001F1165E7|nr:iron ABC transporter permease [Sanguibacter sp. HDW7]